MEKDNSYVISEIQDIIFSYANGDFSRRLEISENYDENDIIASGINMLGEELQEKSVSKDYFLKIFNSIPQIVIVFDINETIDFINKTGLKYFIQNREVSTLKTSDIFPPEIMEKINQLKKTSRKEASFEVPVIRNRKTKYLQSSLIKINEVKDNHFILVAKDITDKKNEEQRILKATILGQELERKRIAFDLHDSLGQELNAMKMYLNAMKYMDITSMKYKKSIANIHSMLDESVNLVREITNDLTPNSFARTDLVSSIKDLTYRLNLTGGVKINTIVSKQEISLKDKNDELIIYRIIQEFLNNSVKHSKAENIYIKISKAGNSNSVTFSLRDDGVGFEMDKVDNKNGILNIIHRLKSLDSEYVYESTPEKGTTLIFDI
ncbi:MAG: nreB [Crocinitomicaceae bacterium]|nr:nreB [Crocinitomicaceae bacterium]